MYLYPIFQKSLEANMSARSYLSDWSDRKVTHRWSSSNWLSYHPIEQSQHAALALAFIAVSSDS